MSKITQGPWNVVEHSWGEAGIYSSDRRVAGLDIRYEATEYTQDEWTARMKADARAISAVPEMMEALEADEKLFAAMVTVLDEDALWPHVSMKVIKDRLVSVHAALAKARGET